MRSDGTSFQRPEDAHQELVGDGRVHAGEDALGEAAALLAGDEHVGAGGPLRVGQVAVLLDDEAAPQRDHHEDAEHAADGGEGHDREVLEVVLPVGEKEQRRAA